MNASEPKLHHYYPQFELRYFTEDDKLWIYDRVKNAFRQQGTKTTGAITDFYTFSDNKGEKITDLEKSLSIVEGISAPIIKKIHEREYRLTALERSELSAYLALKWLRTPIHQRKSAAIYEMFMKTESIKLASNVERFNKMLDEVEKKEGQKSGDRENLREFMKNPDKYSIETERLAGIQTMVSNMRDTGEEIYRMHWIFYYAPKEKSFLTSDNPFFVWPFFESDNPLGYGLRSTPAMTVVPLTPRVCLGLFYRKGKIGHVKRNIPGDMVNEINKQIALYSERFLISHSENLLRRIVKRTNLSKKEPYKVIVEVKSDPRISKDFKIVK